MNNEKTKFIVSLFFRKTFLYNRKLVLRFILKKFEIKLFFIFEFMIAIIEFLTNSNESNFFNLNFLSFVRQRRICEIFIRRSIVRKQSRHKIFHFRIVSIFEIRNCLFIKH